MYIEKWREAHLIGLSWEGAQEESNLFLLKDSSMLDKVEERREWMSGWETERHWEIEILIKEIAIPSSHSHSHPLSLSHSTHNSAYNNKAGMCATSLDIFAISDCKICDKILLSDMLYQQAPVV